MLFFNLPNLIFQLPRQIVKHLIGMEEKILESLAWKGDSPLFTYIESQREIFKRKLKGSYIDLIIYELML